MADTWEDTFHAWSRPPTKTEQQRCENAENSIRNALSSSEALKKRAFRVFTQGSYKNRVNVRRDSDVDIGVCCYDVFFPSYPEGTTKETFGNIDGDYKYSVFKNEVEEALVSYFGRSAVIRGNKAFDLSENTYRVEADVAPFFEHRRYDVNGSYLSGVELRADNTPSKSIVNWPEQHYERGVNKNTSTGRRYKAVVRILKSLCIRMVDDNVSEADNIPGFLIECLVWNVSNSNFGNSRYYDDVRNSLIFLYNGTKDDDSCKEWREVSELLYLFRSTKPWTRVQANNFILAAWQYIGFK